MFEIIVGAFEMLKTDHSIMQVLSTVSATTAALVDGEVDGATAYALSLIAKEAEKKILELLQNNQ